MSADSGRLAIINETLEEFKRNDRKRHNNIAILCKERNEFRDKFNESENRNRELMAQIRDLTKEGTQSQHHSALNEFTNGHNYIQSTQELTDLPLHCLKISDDTDYSSPIPVITSDRNKESFIACVDTKTHHNHKERLRRSQIKCSTDALRALVPGITDKTDKAAVLEHTVDFLTHLSICSGVKCVDYLPSIPPPISANVLKLYPHLMSVQNQFSESIVLAEDQDLDSNELITAETMETFAVDEPIDVLSMDTTVANECLSSEEGMCVSYKSDPLPPPIELFGRKECRKCVAQVVHMLSEDKENIDLKTNAKRQHKTRLYCKKHSNKVFVDSIPDVSNSGGDVVMRSTDRSGEHKLRDKRVFKTKH